MGRTALRRVSGPGQFSSIKLTLLLRFPDAFLHKQSYLPVHVSVLQARVSCVK